MSTDDQAGNLRGDTSDVPQRIGMLATQVIDVLRDRQGVTGQGIRPFVLDHLSRAILARGAFDAAALLDQLRGHRLTLDAVIDLYVPAAATRLGQDWIDDGLSFADVTIGAMRLQALLGEAFEREQTDPFHCEPLLQAMIVVPQGEQHFLGASVLAAQLRRMGCHVSMSFDEEIGVLHTRLLTEAPQLVLISCGSDETVESVAQTVQGVKSSLPPASSLVIGGAGVRDNKKLRERTGVDLVTNQAGDAVALAVSRVVAVPGS
ncbi:MAG: hypothetical protein AAF636_08610 [Pseudomonadota bacterium]